MVTGKDSGGTGRSGKGSSGLFQCHATNDNDPVTKKIAFGFVTRTAQFVERVLHGPTQAAGCRSRVVLRQLCPHEQWRGAAWRKPSCWGLESRMLHTPCNDLSVQRKDVSHRGHPLLALRDEISQLIHLPCQLVVLFGGLEVLGSERVKLRAGIGQDSLALWRAALCHVRAARLRRGCEHLQGQLPPGPL